MHGIIIYGKTDIGVAAGITEEIKATKITNATKVTKAAEASGATKATKAAEASGAAEADRRGRLSMGNSQERKKMDYKEFKEELKAEMEEELGNEKEVTFYDMEKNNHVRREGMAVREKGSSVSAILSLEALHQEYLKSGSMEQAVKEALGMLEKKPEITVGGVPERWEDAKERLHMELVHYEWNRKRLEEIPHRRFLDLAETYWLDLSDREGYSARVPVKQECLLLWGITEEELQEAAMENLKKENYTIQSMAEILAPYLGKELELPETPVEEYVLTNTGGRYGAAGLLREDMLKAFSKCTGGSFYILPSSLHEVILLPDSPQICAKELKQMVREVNGGQVAREEWLSESVYYYDCEMREVRIEE